MNSDSRLYDNLEFLKIGLIFLNNRAVVSKIIGLIKSPALTMTTDG